MRDQKNNLTFEESLLVTSPGTGAENGAEVDMQGYDALTFIAGAGGSAAGTMKIQESDTSGSGYADAAAADVLGTQDTALSVGDVIKLGYVGNARYVRAVLTLSADGPVSVVAIKGEPAQAAV